MRTPELSSESRRTTYVDHGTLASKMRCSSASEGACIGKSGVTAAINRG